MKNTKLALTFSTLISLSAGVQALELQVLSNYNQAESAGVWVKSKPDQVPLALMGNQSVAAPASSYAAIFPKAFLQEAIFAVCHQDCGQQDGFRLKDGEIDSRDKNDWDVFEQSNVYFWLKKYYSYLDTNLQFRPKNFLKVMTNRELRDNGRILKNNAFFDPQEKSLSFLPASKNLLFKLFNGKINRSGFDPSVIAHETSHYLFDHLFPDSFNEEIGGLNEGFADFIANSFLENPKVGLVMLQGKTLRDASNPTDSAGKAKMYEPKMEVHDLGERVAYALWKTRELSSNKMEMERLVIDAILELSNNPYSTIHDFKERMLERLPSIVESAKMTEARLIWDLSFQGEPAKIESFSFLDQPIPDKTRIGFKTKQVIPESMAKAAGIEATQESRLNLLNIEQLAPKQQALLMATENDSKLSHNWVVLDDARGNVLGIFGADKRLLSEKEDVKTAKVVFNQATELFKNIQSFSSTIEEFKGLASRTGTISRLYKVKRQFTAAKTFRFNGMDFQGQVLHMDVKRGLLAGLLLGLPKVTSVELYMIPGPELKKLNDLNGQKVIGYKLLQESGIEIETILEHFNP